MKLLLLFQIIFFIFVLTFNGAAQSGRIKKAISPASERQSSDFTVRKNVTNASSEELTKETKKGLELYFTGQYEEAGEIFENLIETDDQNRTAWFYLGLVYARTDRSESAEKAFANSEALGHIKLHNEPESITLPQIIYMPQPVYPEAVRKNFISGSVKLAVEFGADGKIAFVYPITELDSRLTEIAVRAAWAIKFKPALKDGKPISAVKSLLYTFGIGRR